MTDYTPDRWVVIKMTYKDEVIYKVLGSWSGSYLYGSSWRLNSGIEAIGYDSEEDTYLFKGHSGSVYKCRRESYGMTIAGSDIWKTMSTAHPENVELLPNRDDWTNLLMETENV